MKLLPAALAALAMIASAAARDNGQWADSPAQIREWFRSLMQPDNPLVSCCGEADAFEVEGDHYVAVIIDGKWVVVNGTYIPSPIRKTKWDAAAPGPISIRREGDGMPKFRGRAARIPSHPNPPRANVVRIRRVTALALRTARRGIVSGTTKRSSQLRRDGSAKSAIWVRCKVN
jgi:hypothetical protein